MRLNFRGKIIIVSVYWPGVERSLVEREIFCVSLNEYLTGFYEDERLTVLGYFSAKAKDRRDCWVRKYSMHGLNENGKFN